MANICDVTYKVCGSDHAVKNLFETIQKLDESKKWNLSLAQLAEEYGIDYDKERISVRGCVYFFDFDDPSGVLTICTETAWCGCHELFRAISEKLNGELSISYREVECGCEIFSVHDEGDFFPEQCLVSASGEPFEDGFEEPFETIGEAVDYWCEHMQVDRQGRSDEEMRELIESYDYSDYDTFYYIYEFDFE